MRRCVPLVKAPAFCQLPGAGRVQQAARCCRHCKSAGYFGVQGGEMREGETAVGLVFATYAFVFPLFKKKKSTPQVKTCWKPLH